MFDIFGQGTEEWSEWEQKTEGLLDKVKFDVETFMALCKGAFVPVKPGVKGGCAYVCVNFNLSLFVISSAPGGGH